MRITPEQIRSSTRELSNEPAALIDWWGRPHLIADKCMIGRQVEGLGISLLEASISRNHAQFSKSDDGRWWLRDLGSANGTAINDTLLVEAHALATGDRVRIGQVEFYFLAQAQGLPAVSIDPTLAATIRPSDEFRFADLLPDGRAPDLRATTVDAEATLVEDVAEEFAQGARTDVGLPVVDVALSEPTGGGGGVVRVGAHDVQLTTTQYELVALLIRRMAAESHQPELVRGFVRSSELIADLSWDTHDPGDNHVKQLVRRVRRALVKAEIGDIIESRHRFGYRIRILPRM